MICQTMLPNVACKQNARSYTVSVTDIKRGLTNVTYRHIASYSAYMWFTMPLPNNDTWKTDTSKAEFHLTNSHCEHKQKRGSGAACNDSCIKRISKLTQLANASWEWQTSFNYLQKNRPVITQLVSHAHHTLMLFADLLHWYLKQTNTNMESLKLPSKAD